MSNNKDNNLVFGLDIGTRSIVGTVGYKLSEKTFVVDAMCVKEHNTRAMLDGQIHDIYAVTQTVLEVKQELERAIGTKLEEVCIAAAGRVLMTQTVESRMEYESDHVMTDEDVYSLELQAVEEAYIKLQNEIENRDIRFYCVGYSAVKYYLNGYTIGKLQGHRAQNAGVELLATFLPEEVIEGLYSAVEGAGLKVVNLTLEPIAAINVAIPEKFRLLNIALVDVGAGTSDICITNDGAITAYGMIPFAGDEITEALARKFLIEFNEAERIKVESTRKKAVTFTDIMGIKTKIESEKIREIVVEEFDKITKNIASKIIELNGNKTVSAVFVVGGGGKYPGFVESIAKYLELPESRAALRGEEVLTDIMFKQTNIKKDSLYVTPIGICLNYYENKNSFVKVKANGANIKIFDNNSLTVADVAMQSGIKNEELFPGIGNSLTFYLNGDEKTVRGRTGEPAIIKLNGKEVPLTAPIKDNDEVEIKVSTKGDDASKTIGQLSEYKDGIVIYIDDTPLTIPLFPRVNGELQDKDYQIQDKDDIEIYSSITLENFIKYADLDMEAVYMIDGEELDLEYELEENDKIYCKEDEEETLEEQLENELEEKLEQNDEQKIEQKIENVPTKIENTESVKTSENLVAPVTKTLSMSNDNGNIVFITVNGNVVKLTGKKSYIFVDILDFYDFDTSKLGGNKLIMKVNGVICTFTQPVNDGDNIDIYWE